MLAATTNSEEVMLGGHHRIHVSADGRTVLNSQPLTLSCLRVPRAEDSAMIGVTHSLDSEPIESHVFLNLSYDLPLNVITESDAWLIENGWITKLE